MVSRRPGPTGLEESGAGAVLGVVLAGVLAIAALGCAGATSVVVTHRVAQSAADLAALAGAQATQDGAEPCAAARSSASRNGAELTSCRVRGWEVGVRVSADTGLLPGGRLTLPARARAGPVSSLGPG